eukprot:5494669-Amphidinium_carterae.1
MLTVAILGVLLLGRIADVIMQPCYVACNLAGCSESHGHGIPEEPDYWSAARNLKAEEAIGMDATQ